MPLTVERVVSRIKMGSIRRKMGRQFWGYLGEGTKQFSCARIADCLSDLSLFKPLVFHEVVDRPVETVRTVMTSQGTMIRATVAPSS